MIRIPSIFVFLLGSAIAFGASPEEGKALFKANCNACHHLELRLVGPPLKNVHTKHSEDWLLRFIKSSASVIASGDSTAISLFNTYNKVPMPDQNLSDDEIRSILSYIEVESAGGGDSDAPFARPEVVKANTKPLSFTDFRFWIMYTITVVLTIVAVYYKAEMSSLKAKVEKATGKTIDD